MKIPGSFSWEWKSGNLALHWILSHKECFKVVTILPTRRVNSWTYNVSIRIILEFWKPFLQIGAMASLLCSFQRGLLTLRTIRHVCVKNAGSAASLPYLTLGKHEISSQKQFSTNRIHVPNIMTALLPRSNASLERTVVVSTAETLILSESWIDCTGSRAPPERGRSARQRSCLWIVECPRWPLCSCCSQHWSGRTSLSYEHMNNGHIYWLHICNSKNDGVQSGVVGVVAKMGHKSHRHGFPLPVLKVGDRVYANLLAGISFLRSRFCWKLLFMEDGVLTALCHSVLTREVDTTVLWQNMLLQRITMLSSCLITCHSIKLHVSKRVCGCLMMLDVFYKWSHSVGWWWRFCLSSHSRAQSTTWPLCGNHWRCWRCWAPRNSDCEGTGIHCRCIGYPNDQDR